MRMDWAGTSRPREVPLNSGQAEDTMNNEQINQVVNAVVVLLSVPGGHVDLHIDRHWRVQVRRTLATLELTVTFGRPGADGRWHRTSKVGRWDPDRPSCWPLMVADWMHRQVDRLSITP